MEGSVRSSWLRGVGFRTPPVDRLHTCPPLHAVRLGNFVDVLRLAADEGDRSLPILCDWTVLSDTMNPVVSSCGVPVQPTERLGDPTKFNYIVVVGGLIDEIPNLGMKQPDFFEQERHGDLNKMAQFFKAVTESNNLAAVAFRKQRAGSRRARQSAIRYSNFGHLTQ